MPSPPTLIVERVPGLRFVERLAVVVGCSLMLLLMGPACEDEVVDQPPPQPQAQGGGGGGGGGGGRGPRGGKAKAGEGMYNRGAVELVTDVALPEKGEEEVPEPNPDAVYGTLHVSSPWVLSQLIGELFGTSVSVTQGDIARLVGEAYGLPPLGGVRWSSPAVVCFLDGANLPMLVLEVSNRDELLDRLPEDSIKARQGNELTFLLGPSGSAYLNFVDDHVVLAANWKHFPQATELLPELLEKEPTELVTGSVDLARFPGLTDALSSLEAPLPAMGVGWDEWVEAIDLVLGSVRKLDVTLTRDADKDTSSLVLQFQAPESGSLRTLVENAEPADPLKLLELVDQTRTTLWLWHDLRHDPLVWDGAAAASVSIHLGSDPPAPFLDLELQRSRTLAGPTLLATGHRAGEQERQTWRLGAATVANEKRLLAANSEVKPPLHMKDTDLGLEIEGSLVAQYKADDQDKVAVEVLRNDTLLGLTATSSETLANLLAPVEAKPYMPEVFSAQDGKPLFLLVGQFAEAVEGSPPPPPLALALRVTGTGLSLHAQLPDAQLERLALKDFWAEKD